MRDHARLRGHLEGCQNYDRFGHPPEIRGMKAAQQGP